MHCIYTNSTLQEYVSQYRFFHDDINHREYTHFLNVSNKEIVLPCLFFLKLFSLPYASTFLNAYIPLVLQIISTKRRSL